jgi:hypothetical protein
MAEPGAGEEPKAGVLDLDFLPPPARDALAFEARLGERERRVVVVEAGSSTLLFLLGGFFIVA